MADPISQLVSSNSLDNCFLARWLELTVKSEEDYFSDITSCTYRSEVSSVLKQQMQWTYYINYALLTVAFKSFQADVLCFSVLFVFTKTRHDDGKSFVSLFGEFVHGKILD